MNLDLISSNSENETLKQNGKEGIMICFTIYFLYITFSGHDMKNDIEWEYKSHAETRN
jgi:hypothetical protein